MKKILSVIALLSCTALGAQESNREADSLRYQFGRQKILSQTLRKGTPYADTLDTGCRAAQGRADGKERGR